jgi:hypothetical protein
VCVCVRRSRSVDWLVVAKQNGTIRRTEDDTRSAQTEQSRSDATSHQREKSVTRPRRNSSSPDREPQAASRDATGHVLTPARLNRSSAFFHRATPSGATGARARRIWPRTRAPYAPTATVAPATPRDASARPGRSGVDHGSRGSLGKNPQEITRRPAAAMRAHAKDSAPGTVLHCWARVEAPFRSTPRLRGSVWFAAANWSLLSTKWAAKPSR